MVDSQEAMAAALKYAELDSKIKELEEKLKEQRSIIEENIGEVTEKVQLGNLVISIRKGANKVDYKKFIDDNGIVVPEEYTIRGKDSIVFSVSNPSKKSAKVDRVSAPAREDYSKINDRSREF